jgi:hypothetical protein
MNKILDNQIQLLLLLIYSLFHTLNKVYITHISPRSS